MHRRHFLRTSAGVLSLAALPLPLLATPRSGLFTPIRRGVGRFEDRGGTIGWLINPDGVVVVDTQFAESAAECRQGLIDRSGRGVDWLINSHHHGDHTRGNAAMAGSETTLVAHANVSTLQQTQYAERGWGEPLTATTTYEETWSQDIGDETVHLSWYGPAHTSGDSIIHFEKADVVHMGDLVFHFRSAVIDLAGGADTRNWMSLLEQVHDRFTDNTVFIFGHANPAHGVLGTRSDLLIMRDYLEALHEAVARGIQAGRSGDEIAEAGLPGFESHMVDGDARGIAGNLRTIHQEMTTVHE
jgi:cyclase